MKLIHSTVVALSVSFLISGCSPQNILRLETDHEDKMVYRGMEYLYSEGEESTVTLAYYRHLNDRLIMDLEVINYSDSVIQVDNSDFTVKSYERKFVSGEQKGEVSYEEKFISETHAIDPEKTILDVDKQISREEASERTSLLLDGISVGLNVAADIADASNYNSYDREEREIRLMNASIDRAERRDLFYRNVSSLNHQRQYWETEVIRRTDLYPGESIAGEINFPVIEDALRLEILIKVGDEIHQFEYRQRTHVP